ncbi:MAG: BamA/TamA family outer membrane protein [Candidatus Krumholzibacteriia bacterium]
MPVVSIVHCAGADTVDDSGVAHAYGTVVDSIVVAGNKNTKSHVLLREMETRPGDVLDREIFRRDLRFITDLSPFATVVARADSVAPGHSALRILVTERSNLFIKSILPFAKFDFEKGLTYGVRWRDKNFRGRLEQLNFKYTRNEQDDEDISLSWTVPWLGWRHISVGGRMSFFDRGDTPPEFTVHENIGLSGFVALPLTESRIHFSQARFILALDKRRLDGGDDGIVREVTLSPQVGYRFDSRDSPLRPETGVVTDLAMGARLPLDGDSDTLYNLRNESKIFLRVSPRSVIGLLSNFFYQFGNVPEFADVKLGGAASLRGHPDARFSGLHRWFQTAEWRYLYLPKRVFRLPLVKQFDVSLVFVTFVDGGIVWDHASEFDPKNFHGTGGVGIRFYSPLRDVVRFDFGSNTRGDARFHFETGVRF